MKIRTKTIATTAAVTVLLMIIVYFISHNFLSNQFFELEKENVAEDTERALNALNYHIKGLAKSNQDWAKWDDTYFYIEDRNKDYENSNLNIGSFKTLEVDEVVYMDANGNFVYGKIFDHEEEQEGELSENDLIIYKNLHLLEVNSSGLMKKDGKIMLFSKSPILMGSQDSISNGELYFVSSINEIQIERLEEMAQMKIAILPLEGYSYLGEENSITESNLVKDKKTFVFPVDSKTIKSYALLKDFNDVSIGVIEITLSREIMEKSNYGLKYLLFFIIAFGFTFGVSVFIIMEKLIFSKVSSLNNEVKLIGEHNYIKKRMTESGSDELTTLAHSINLMLGEIEDSEKKIRNNAKELEREKISLKTKTYELNDYIKELEDMRTATINMLEDLRETNEHLKDMDKVKSNFLNIVSHELKTPLTAIFAYLDILKDMKKNLTEDQKKGFDAIKRNSDQLKGIINNILEISRIEAGKFEVIVNKINPKEKINNVVQNLKPLAEKKGIEFKVKLDKYLTEMETDEQRFEEILNNLISNAIKFTEKGHILITSEKEGTVAKFNVIDTGVGIPEDKISQLFQKFYQVDASISRKFGGTGLGLSITKQLIELQGGKIWVKSLKGKGTTFSFILPIKQKRKKIKNA